MPKVRIINTTAALKQPGFGLEFGGNYIAANRPLGLVLDLPVIPAILEEWKSKGWARLEDATEQTPLSKPGEADVTRGTVVQEVAATTVDALDEEEEFNLFDAKEASLPADSTAPIDQAPEQDASRARVTLGTAEEHMDAGAVSPIPGDRPRSVDDSDEFTIRAPRAPGVGAVISGSKS